MGMKTEQPNSADKALKDDILKLIRAHLTLNTPERVLAIASQVVGQALALQNPVTLGKTAAIDLIQANIKKGNQDYVNTMLQARSEPRIFPMN